jgi:serine/threonine-protein kinase
VNQDPFAGRGGTQAVLGPGSQVAGYLLERQIGTGGMAVVYQARDVRLGRLVALKVMAPALAGDETFRLRFVREAQTAAAVDDPHIIPVYEAGEAGGILFIAMRFVGGGDLRSQLRREGPLAPDRVMAAIAAVAAALDAAHAAGLVHRDVKPANMLRDTRPGRPDHVYLSDFGLSKGMRSSQLTGSSQFLGTPDYTAPEQIEGAAADGRTDQYALACSAFQLLTGTVPFARGESWQTVWAHLNTPPPTLTALRPELPPAVDAVFARAMAKSPPDRFPDCRTFADALGSALAGGYFPVAPPAARSATTGATPAVGTGAAPTTVGPATAGLLGLRGTTAGRRRRRPPRRRRVIGLTAAVVACTGVTALLVVPHLTGSAAATDGPGPSANPSLFGLAAVFTPPTKAEQWQEATSVAFSTSGKTLAVGLTTGSPNAYSASTFRGETYLFNVASGKQSAVLPQAGGTAVFSPDGKQLAASGGTGQRTVYLVKAVDMDHALALSTLPGTGGQQIKNLVFSPNGRLLAADDTSGGFSLWSTATGRPVGTEIAGPSASSAMAFSPDGKTIAVAGANAISLWDVGIGSIMASIPVHGGGLIGPLTYSPDGRLLAAAVPDGQVGLWDATTHALLGTLQDTGSQGATALAISPDSQTLAVGDANGKTYLWDLRTRKLIVALTNPVGPVPPGLSAQTLYAVDSVAFSPDGRTLATSDTDGSAYLWRVH